MKKYRFNDSTLDMKERVADLLSRLTIDEKASMLSSHMAAVPRLGRHHERGAAA